MDLRNAIVMELENIEALLHMLKKDKKRLRKSCITSRTIRDHIYYYMVTREKGKTKKLYLGKADSEKVRQAADKNYKAVLADTLTFDKKLLKNTLAEFRPYDSASIKSRLSPCLSDLDIEDPVLALLKKLKDWADEPYETNTYDFPEQEIYAKDGRRVRSRIECIIYNALLDAGIPFRYDPVIEFETTNQYGETVTIRKSPDFLFMCLDGSYVILEHAGLLEKSDYTDNLSDKIKLYFENGYTLGDNFFITSDDKKGGVNTHAISQIIDIIIERIYRGAEITSSVYR